jgi:radical SAM protein with 4Fe4S-binding SPASM domain
MTREDNQRLNAHEYEQALAVLHSRPQFLVIELTQGCNLHCPMCRADVISTAQSRMAPDHFDQVAVELFPTANLVDLRGWGESLILPDITHYIERTGSAGCRIRFVSNLSFRRQNVLDCLAQHDAMLTCSLDAATPEVLVRLRKGAQWAAIIDNLAYLARVHPHPEMLAVLCTVQTPALASLPQLPELLAWLGIHHLHLASVSSKNPELGLDFNSSFAQEQVRQTMVACHRFQVTPTLTTSLPGTPMPPMPRCMRPWTTMYVNISGKIGYCDHLIGPFAESQLLGHLSEGALAVWNNEEWQKIRTRHIVKSPQFKKCVKCYRDKGTDFEPMWLGKEWS